MSTPESIELPPPFRPAVEADARAIAELIAISSDGVAVIEWTEEADKSPGREPLDVGEATYRQAVGDYSYRNCVIAELQGQVAGMLLCFAMGPRDPSNLPSPPPFDGTDVFAPYKYLEAPDTWYICGLALFPHYRNQGLGSRLLEIARQQARARGFERLSLVAFEQNTGSVRLYLRQGFRVIDRAPVVPHPLIHYAGDALLMVADA